MANRNFPSNKIYNMHVMPVSIDAQIAIAAAGAPAAPTLQNAPGIQSITRLAVGQYVIQMQDNYAKLLDFDINFKAPASGVNVAVTAAVTGTVYQISVLGTTTTANWHAMGVPADITPAVGIIFLKSATAGVGTGQVQILLESGIAKVEQLGLLENSNNPVANAGARIYIKCLGYTSSADNTLIPADPASGSTMFMRFSLNNSQVQ